ncbi:hypothetical protein F8M41_002558 [Gigaspora margarita]|uniref:Zn(2)-C6 fungal-type domain-containing protein n=1 Tax=Gigaspora margarita TaxID=4874 RepID=A0A8H4AYL2_GIGMA|nr:hypothetical protein F8M41_002558 [Gigaspora margarita]
MKQKTSNKNYFNFPYETLVKIFDNLGNLDALNLARTSKYLSRIFRVYNYPTPKRDVLISAISVATYQGNPKKIRFSQTILRKRKHTPIYLEFDGSLLLCNNCKYFKYMCNSKKPCNMCTRHGLRCEIVETSIRKRIKITDKGEYFCFSPFTRGEKLICVKEWDIGKRKCEKCNLITRCGMMPVFNGCGMVNCSLSTKQDEIDLFAMQSISHYHMLCQSCYSQFPTQYNISYIKKVEWRDQ